MTDACLGSPQRPLRVAVVGAGPAGFYTVEALLKHSEIHVDIDLIERLPAPYGLLRYGVAPDHPKIKAVSAAYDRLGDNPRVRYLGNVGVGLGCPGNSPGGSPSGVSGNAPSDAPPDEQGSGAAGGIGVDDLLACYDQVVFTVGCESDRRLSIPGEDLDGSHSATAFVAWYNGHPDYVDLPVNLSVERAVVVGIGDVAMDLARMLLRNPEDLAATDITAKALAALRLSRIREVVILARRGPGEAAFAAKELEDIIHLDEVEVSVDADLVRRAQETVDPHSSSERHKLEVLAKAAATEAGTKPRRLVLRFLASPLEITGLDGHVAAVHIENNELVVDDGRVIARGNGREESIEAGLVLRSVGYRGVPLPGLPFDDAHGIVPNVEGRVQCADGPWPGLYVAGWIKRGATGVVGTNKGDAAATVTRMVEDLPTQTPKAANQVSRAAFDALLQQRGVKVVTWEGWKRIDRREKELGLAAGKIREKLARIEDLLAAAES